MWRRNKEGSIFGRRSALPHAPTAVLGTTMAGELMRALQAQAAKVALDLRDSVVGRIDGKGDGRGEGVDRVDVGGLMLRDTDLP